MSWQMRMNDQTKIVYALEHIAHLYDLIEDNYWEDYLRENLDSIEYVLEAQLTDLYKKKRINYETDTRSN